MSFKSGDRVKIIGQPHALGQYSGTIAYRANSPAYAIKLDGHPWESPHRWYVGEELALLNPQEEPPVWYNWMDANFWALLIGIILIQISNASHGEMNLLMIGSMFLAMGMIGMFMRAYGH